MQDISNELNDNDKRDESELDDREPAVDVNGRHEDEDPRLITDKQETIAVRYFAAGFFLLPFVWLTSYFYFRDLLTDDDDDDAVLTAKTRRLVRIGFAFFWLELLAVVAWIVVFSVWRVDMGSVGDALLVAYPKGRI